MWFGPVDEGTYIHMVCPNTSVVIRNYCKDVGDPLMATGTTKGQPCKVMGMFFIRGLDTIRAFDILLLRFKGIDPCD